jgi:hypothetical protein
LVAAIHFAQILASAWQHMPDDWATTTRAWASVPALTHRCYRSQACRFSPAGFSFAVVGRGELLLLPFKAMLLSERARGLKSGGPPLFAPSFKVQGDIAHNSKAPGSQAPPV